MRKTKKVIKKEFQKSSEVSDKTKGQAPVVKQSQFVSDIVKGIAGKRIRNTSKT